MTPISFFNISLHSSSILQQHEGVNDLHIWISSKFLAARSPFIGQVNEKLWTPAFADLGKGAQTFT